MTICKVSVACTVACALALGCHDAESTSGNQDDIDPQVPETLGCQICPGSAENSPGDGDSGGPVPGEPGAGNQGGGSSTADEDGACLGDCSVPIPCLDCTSDLFLNVGSSGVFSFKLVPSPAATTGSKSLVAFSVPFPRGTLHDAGQVVIADFTGHEVPAYVEALSMWQGPSGPDGIRAVVVWTEITLATNGAVDLQLYYGIERELQLPKPGSVRDVWKPISEADYSQPVHEPPAYALLPTDWLSASLVLGRHQTLGQPSWAIFEDFFVGATYTALNMVASEVTKTIDYESDPAPWLFDRAATLFGAYLRTGDAVLLRKAHRAAEYYRSHVSSTGYFDLKSYDDLKYSYTQSLVADYLLTGNSEIPETVEAVARAGAEWEETYSPASSFWTERHQAYALFAAVGAAEITGFGVHRQRAQEIVDALKVHTVSPPGGYPADGCIIHSFEAHEGANSNDGVCSPWMSALLVDALWRHYLTTKDITALEVIYSIARGINEQALYTDTVFGETHLLPYYLASSQVTFTDAGPWADMEHACDVAGLLVRGAWAAKALGKGETGFDSSIRGLRITCDKVLESWVRPDGVTAGLAEYRLSPPRKYNWWFKSTLDMSWMTQQLNN